MTRKAQKSEYQDAIAQLATYLSLSDEALMIAEGWSLLPVDMQRHFKILIDDYIASQAPALRTLYGNASLPDQLRFNRIIERAQANIRGRPSDGIT